MSTHPPEKWLPIPGWSAYQIEAHSGRVRSVERVDSRGRRLRSVELKRQGTGKGTVWLSQQPQKPQRAFTVDQLFALAGAAVADG